MRIWFRRILSSLAGLLSCGLLLAAEAENKAGPLTNEPIGAGSYFQMVLGLIFIVALIVGMGWFIRRMGSFNTVASGNLKLLGGLSLGQRERIVLVQVGETQLLVGVGPGQIRTLHVLEEPVSMEGGKSQATTSSFADKLNMLLKQKPRS